MTLAARRALRVIVVTADLGNATASRAYHLADLLSRRHQVRLVGPSFGGAGSEIWEPIRGGTVPLRSFPGRELPVLLQDIARFTRGIQADIVYVCRPQLPSLLLGMTLKHVCGAPVIVDFDQSFTVTPASLDEVAACGDEPKLAQPFGRLWSRVCDGLATEADAATVSSSAALESVGGSLIPHVRDERRFDPARFDRGAVRAELGFSRGDRVVVVSSSERAAASVRELSRALQELGDPRNKLCLIGHQPVAEIPRLTVAGDLVWIGAAWDRDDAPDGYGAPPELTEALAMGVPVLARDSPALEPFGRHGSIHLTGDAPLATRLTELLSDPTAAQSVTLTARKRFLEQLSYGAVMDELDGVIESVAGTRKEAPSTWRRAWRLAGSVGTTDRPAGRRAPDDRPAAPRAPGPPPHDRPRDLVCFWKLNDSGIYGRRADMLTKYLAQSERTRRLVHFDKPTDWDWIDSRRHAARKGINHWDLIARRGRKLAFVGEREGKLRSYMFVSRRAKDPSTWQRALLPSADEYLGFVADVLERNAIGKRHPVLFWVWPPNFEFAALHQAFTPAITVADVVDDERSWAAPGSPRFEHLTRNHEQIFALSDLVVTHNEPLAERLRWFGAQPAVVPNATELFSERPPRRPRELRHLKGPIIGYSGTLSYRIDLELLDRIARERPDHQLVIIGSAHGPEEILALDQHPNVHFLGVRTYPDVTRYIRCFDVAIIPHLDDEMSRGMNPLKAYLYASCGIPAVSTQIANLDLAQLDGAIRITHTHDQFLDAIDQVIQQRRTGQLTLPTRQALQPHTWAQRVRQLEALIDTATS